MATLRGNRESALTAIADTLKLVAKFEKIEDMRKGIRSVIKFVENDRDKFKSKKQDGRQGM